MTAHLTQQQTRYFKTAWNDFRLLTVIGALYIVLCVAQFLMIGGTVLRVLKYAQFNLTIVLLLYFVVFIAVAGAVFIKGMVIRPFHAGGLRAQYLRATDGIEAFLVRYFKGPLFPYAVFGVFPYFAMIFFIFQKDLVRFVHPYAWDHAFMAWDKILHFGQHPYQLLIDWIGGLKIGGLLEDVYFKWFVVSYVALAYNLFFDRRLGRRMQFMWTLSLSWMLLGGILATVLSSICPIFWHEFYAGDNPYQGLLDHLAANRDDISGILLIQQKLLEWNRSDNLLPPNAIAAMPSMHIAIAWLIVLYMRSVHFWAFLAAAVFFVLVFISCVYFGFHYALDGYVSIVLISIIWFLAGKCLDVDRRDNIKNA